MSYTVLVIDDKEVFRRKIKRLPYWQTCRDKFTIQYEAQNGVEALDILRGSHIDVTLTDIRMPFIDGIELLKQVNAENLCRCVILLSEFAEFSYAKAGILNGAFDYVLKPIDNDKIQETFDRAYHYLTTIHRTAHAPSQKIESLAEFILSDDRLNALAYANHIEAGFQAQATAAGDRIVLANEALTQVRASILQKRGYLQSYIPFDELCRIDPKDKTCDQLVSVFSAHVMAIMDALSPFLIRSQNPMVMKLCQMALEGSGRKLSLRELADSLFVNPKYLGSLFKKEMGVSFSQYVNFLKMEQAKILLRNPDQKMYEIAAMLGYKDVDYFSRSFKKECSVSPSFYREMRLS